MTKTSPIISPADGVALHELGLERLLYVEVLLVVDVLEHPARCHAGHVGDRVMNRREPGVHVSRDRRVVESDDGEIRRQLEAEHPGLAVRILHRLGAIEVGAASIAIAASSPRRDAAFAVARAALERVKREVPIWKLERYADGTSSWREEEPLAAPTRSD